MRLSITDAIAVFIREMTVAWPRVVTVGLMEGG